MSRIFLGLGSNINAERNLAAGIARLSQRYSLLRVSPWYRSPAMGFDGPDFINLVVEIDCDCSPAELVSALKQLEFDFGRAPDAVKYSSRALDIDILLFDDLVGDVAGLQLPRSDIQQFAFVLRPLLDIFPDGVNPADGTPLADYWAALASQPLYPVRTRQSVIARG
ncbi:MAG: 2-amino-4-hydroxy-6-hydroxymethyldihydropteridine diphosphokinase [Saccharospirillaceae bacterium]|nr:2-amino-4-hydroxy-6-hydroxymethyldihydropteridine diphosphokinase [Saccharospirillaceae bacterium]MCD8530319.1 2-amino-4-hydroxy-6-hydroxymethyldihydropteridine diphosphokinase [Saccharospirillaceae bacterium]